jgi:hypothetical protein
MSTHVIYTLVVANVMNLETLICLCCLCYCFYIDIILTAVWNTIHVQIWRIAALKKSCIIYCWRICWCARAVYYAAHEPCQCASEVHVLLAHLWCTKGNLYCRRTWLWAAGALAGAPGVKITPGAPQQYLFIAGELALVHHDTPSVAKLAREW